MPILYFFIKNTTQFEFSFIYDKDYNSKIIKIDLFFFEFAIFYTINALFFNDNTMHEIYVNKSEFDFIYQLPQTIYSSIISIILNKPLEILALSNDGILKFKAIKKKKKIKKRRKELKRRIFIKIIFYFN